MITGSHVWRETIDIFGFSGLDATITQERIPVLVPVGDIIVLDPGIFDGLQEMNGLFHASQQQRYRGGQPSLLSTRTYRTWPEVNPVLDLPVLEPTSAFFLPHRCLVEFIKVRVNLVDGFLLDGHAFNAFVLHFLHHFDRVFDGRLYAGE